MTDDLDVDAFVRRRTVDVRIALSVASGEVVAVMGPSGAGKSTLLEAIAGYVHLDGGHVSIGGRTVAGTQPRVHVRPERRGVAVLGQDPLLFPHMTARDNVAFALQARRVSRADARTQADGWLEQVGLAGLGSRRPASLSGGQQQRAALVRALAASPSVLLLDEPLTGLDPLTASEVRTALRAELATARAATVLVTHDVRDALALAHRLVVIEDGRITHLGAVADVLASPATAFGEAIAELSAGMPIDQGGRR